MSQSGKKHPVIFSDELLATFNKVMHSITGGAKIMFAEKYDTSIKLIGIWSGSLVLIYNKSLERGKQIKRRYR